MFSAAAPGNIFNRSKVRVKLYGTFLTEMFKIHLAQVLTFLSIHFVKRFVKFFFHFKNDWYFNFLCKSIHNCQPEKIILVLKHWVQKRSIRKIPLKIGQITNWQDIYQSIKNSFLALNDTIFETSKNRQMGSIQRFKGPVHLLIPLSNILKKIKKLTFLFDPSFLNR